MFFNCQNLVNVEIPKNINSFEGDGITGTSIFYQCNNFKTIKILNDKNMINLGCGVFAESLEKIFVPNNLLDQYKNDKDWKYGYGDMFVGY